MCKTCFKKFLLKYRPLKLCPMRTDLWTVPHSGSAKRMSLIERKYSDFRLHVA